MGEELSEIPKGRQFSRRTLLKATLGAGLGLIFGREDSGAEAEQLSYEEARKLVESTVDLFIDNVNPQRSREEILGKIFILRGEFATAKDHDKLSIEEIKRVDGISNLLSDYPSVEFPDETVKEVVRLSSSPLGSSSAEGFIAADKVFINIDSINNKKYIGDFKQYLGVKGSDGCKTSTPTSHLRSVLLHELSHQDSPFIRTIDKSVAEAAIEFSEGRFMATNQERFYLKGKTPTGEKTVWLTFEEIIADYMASKISQQNKLYFVAGYSPIDVFNFSVMLDAAKISDSDLIRLHREGNLLEFLLRIGTSALKTTRPEGTHSEDQALKTAFLLASKIEAKFPPDWAFVKQFFPKIELLSFESDDGKSLQRCQPTTLNKQ